jgi:sulfide:quinone oxidoreductase
MDEKHVDSRRPGALSVLVAGGGVAAFEATLALRALAEDRVSIDLLSADPRFWYRPLAVVEPFGIGHLHGIEVTELAAAAGATFTLGALAAVEPARHVAVTAGGAELDYDVLLLATGAKPVAAVAGAFTFRGPADSDALRALLAEVEAGTVRRLVFAVPGGVAWPLPLYELALLTAASLAQKDFHGVELTLVTPEDVPLGVFGTEASGAVRRLLEERGIEVLTGRTPVSAEEGRLTLAPDGDVPADRVIALPRLRGERIAGLPANPHGFVPTDPHGRVKGVDDVFAAGDITAFPVKQGGIAAQQADAAAQSIAARAGAELTPQPFRPILRGLLLTGAAPAYLRSEVAGGAGDTSTAETEAVWWPPGKIVGRYLSPFLAEYAGVVITPPEGVEAIRVDVAFSADERSAP